MTDYKEENDELRREIKRLTQENKALRMTALDEFAKAAMHAAVTKCIHNFKVEGTEGTVSWFEISESCYDAAKQMLYEKVRRYES